MSLTVHARRVSATGKGEFETLAAPHNDLAGFEAWRSSVWGSPAAVRLGLRVLPRLANENIQASGRDLDDLEADVKLLQGSLRAFVDELLATGVHVVASHAWAQGIGWVPSDPYETIRYRLANIAEAVRVARSFPDGEGQVIIW